MTLRFFLWSFTMVFYVYAKFHPCSSLFKGAQLIEVKKKRVFRNTLYLRILHFQLRQNCLGTHAKNHWNRATFTIFYRFFTRAKISRPTYSNLVIVAVIWNGLKYFPSIVKSTIGRTRYFGTRIKSIKNSKCCSISIIFCMSS